MGKSLSPLRYPGGKTQLYTFINHTLNLNKINNATYCEPFCGGSGAAISLLLSNHVENVILNDYDKAIYSFWHAIIYDTKRFIAKINEIPINMISWREQREIYQTNNEKPHLGYDFDLGFATFFLNRTNRAGIITGGPIGGYAQVSEYKLDCRFNKKDLINKIFEVAKNLDVSIEMISFSELAINILIDKTKADEYIYSINEYIYKINTI